MEYTVEYLFENFDKLTIEEQDTILLALPQQEQDRFWNMSFAKSSAISNPKKLNDLIVSEERSVLRSELNKQISKEDYRKMARKAMETLGEEGLTARAKKRAENLGEENLKEISKKAMKTMGEEGLKARAKKYIENMGKEGLSIKAKKVAETLGKEGCRNRSLLRESRISKEAKKQRTLNGHKTRKANEEKLLNEMSDTKKELYLIARCPKCDKYITKGLSHNKRQHLAQCGIEVPTK
jgi:hypothetical protein